MSNSKKSSYLRFVIFVVLALVCTCGVPRAGLAASSVTLLDAEASQSGTSNTLRNFTAPASTDRLSGVIASHTTDINSKQFVSTPLVATIVVADTALRVGETTLVTFTFNQAVLDFTNADLTVANGTLSAVSSSDGDITWTATLTPTANTSDVANVITLDLTGVTDTASNAGSGTISSNNYRIDTQRPTVTLLFADTTLRAGETSLVTFTFSEAVSGFTNADLTVANGTLSSISSSDGGITWTATFTPSSNTSDATNVITLNLAGVSDLFGNAGSGTTDSSNYTIDTQRPSATIIIGDNSLTVGEMTLVTFTFNEAVTGFTNADLTVANGTLSSVSTADGGITWTATFTPSSNTSDATNVITLNLAGVSDAAGNAGSGATDSSNYAIDTQRPSVTIIIGDNSLTVGETTLVTFTFSEAVTGFTNADLTVANGTLSSISSSDGGATWTATLTPAPDTTDATNVITLDLTGVSDAAGNTGNGTVDSSPYAIDTLLRCFTSLDGATTYASSANSQAVRDAVTAASNGGTVRVAGSCADVAGGELVNINKALTLAGGYTTTNWLTSDPDAYPTTLDAQASGRVIYATEPLTVANLIIQNGLVDDGDGGGIYAFGDLTINNSLIRDNVAAGAGFDSYGGGVSVRGLVNVTGSTFTNNIAENDGGGLYVMGMLTITDTTFLSNTAGSRGGGLHIYGNLGVSEIEFDPSRLTDVTFQNNSAGAGGGGAYLRNGAEMTGLAFFDNSAATGGALFFAGITTTPIEVSNSRFGRNRATTNQGDVIYFFDEYPAQVDLLHNTLVNSAPTGGSALYLNMGSLNITNTIIASHTVAILNSGGAVTEDYNLFYANDTNLSGAVSSSGHSLVDDPAFVDPTNDDYDLSATSKALDRGTAAGIAEDWAGDLRPQGNGYDIGADETPYTAPYLCFATLDGSTIYESFTAQALHDAIAAASAGDTVRMAGDCVGNLPLSITIPITLSGGYTTSDWLTPDLTAYPTTLDGDGSRRVLSITGEIAVTLQGVTLQNGDAGTENGGCLYIDRSTVTLNDTTITGCQAVDGGGVRVGSTLILNAGTVISGNTATGNGGGILVNGTPTATVIIQGGEILSNTAVNGGGVAVLGSGNSLTMTSGAISDNVAQGVDSADDAGGDGLGGGLYSTGAVWLTGGTLENNRAQGGNGGDIGSDGGGLGGNGRGGAIYNDGGASLTIANVSLAGNRAVGGAGYGDGSLDPGGNGGEGWGGAIENAGTLQLSDTELRENLAQGGAGGRGLIEGGPGGLGVGGALVLFGSDPITLTNVQFLTNTAQGGAGASGGSVSGDGGNSSGGALYHEPSLSMTDSNLQGNRAVAGAGGLADGGSAGNAGLSEGGAIYAAETLVITATSFFANSADHGGALYQYNSDFTLDQRIVNSVFAHNAAWLSSTGAAIHYNDEGAIELLHNTISTVGTGTPTGVAALWFDQADSVAISNTMIVAHDVGIANNDGALTVTGAGNLFFDNSTADTIGNFAAGFALSNGDPAFADAANDDYRLTSSSAAIERGVDAGILDDFDGALRPQGIAPDVGAFESSYIARCLATADNGATVHLSQDSTAVRSAIADAVTLPSSEVQVAGTCEGVTTKSGTTQLALITRTLTLRGGYTITNWLTSDPSANPTTLDALNSGRVIRSSQPLTVENLIIQHGQATISNGGGIYAGSTLALLNSTVNNNAVTGSSSNGLGGGVWVSGVATITGSSFSTNTATVNGGGAYLVSTATVTGSNFTNNTAGTSGGGAYLNNTGTVATTTFTDNQSTNNAGGGLYARRQATITDSTFQGNTATAHSGGGLYGAADVTVATTDFLNNQAAQNGGGARIFGNATLTEVSFQNNRASGDGGGARITGAATIVDSSFLSNTSTTGEGGGLYGGDVTTITDSNFSNNSAYDNGGAASLIGATTVQTTTFQNNQSTDFVGGALYVDDDVTIIGTDFLSNITPKHSGGALYSTNSVTATTTNFLHNSAGRNGGGVRSFGNATFTDVTFTDNSAEDQGGGAYVDGLATISNATFERNTATTDVGGALSAGAAIITATSWYDNQAQTGGGALYLYGNVGTATRVVNNQFARNGSANQEGDAIAVGAGNGVNQATLLYNTIAHPTLGSGSAVHVYSGTVGITNTIIASHTIAIERTGGTVTENYNLFFGNGSDLLGTVSSGGQSRTGDPRFADSASDDYTLTAGSAALHVAADAGINEDFHGDPRPQGGGFDVGALESALILRYCFTSLDGVTTYSASVDSQAVRDAAGAAVSGATVHIAGYCAGVSGNTVLTQVVAITQPLTLLGGYASVPGSDTVDWGVRDADLYATALDALAEGRVIYATDAVTVTDLVVQNGIASGSDSACPHSGCGGGIFADNLLTLDNVQVLANSAEQGGGVYGDMGVTVTVGYFANNSSSGDGGGLRVAGAASVTGTTFLNNTATNGGGAVFDAAATVTNTTFTGNTTAVAAGGGYFNGVATLTNVTFATNSAGTASGGGALFAATATLTAGSFTDNTADFAGGGAYFNGDAATNGTTFTDNTATNDQGGGAYFNGTAALVDTDFTGNTGTLRAGGLYLGGLATLNGGTIQANECTNSCLGGGLFAVGTLTMTNTQFISNMTDGEGGGLYNTGSGMTISATWFLSNTATNGGGLYSLQPLTVTASYFVNNYAAVDGGGLLALGDLALSASEVTANWADSSGGGFALYGPTTIRATTFLSNTAFNAGGAIYAEAPLTLTASVLTNNQSDTGAGAHLLDAMIVTTSRFISNTAAYIGGAIYHEGPTGRIENSLFVGNQSDSGDAAALFLGSPAVEILYTTIVEGTTTTSTTLAAATMAEPLARLLTTDTLPSSVETIPAPAGQQQASTEDAAEVEPGLHRDLHWDFDRDFDWDFDRAATDAFTTAGPRSLAAACCTAFGQTAIVLIDGPVSITNSIIAGYYTSIENYSSEPLYEDHNLYTWFSHVPVHGYLVVGGHSIVGGDPDFVDPAALDYRLGANSDALGLAVDLGIIDDIDGNPRPQNGFDSGAFESADTLPVEADLCYATLDDGATVYQSADAQAVRDAVAAANPGDTVKIAGYCSGLPHLYADGVGSLVAVTQPLTLIGGYTATMGLPGWAASDPGAYVTMFDPQQLGRSFYLTSPVTMTALTLLNGYSGHDGGAIDTVAPLTLTTMTLTNNRSDGYGAALYSEGDLLITDSTFSDNTALENGGALYGEAAVTIDASLFFANTADYDGGALEVDGPLTITASQFMGNQAGAQGGAIDSDLAATISATDFVDNVAAVDGGAVENDDGLTIQGGQFINNRAGDDSGAVDAGSWLTINDAYFFNNQAWDEGGAARSLYQIVISNTQFISNATVYAGGAIRAEELWITATHFISNSADLGGAAYLSSWYTSQVSDSLFEGNLATTEGGAFFVENGPLLYLERNRFFRNRAVNGGGALYLSSATVNLLNNFLAGNQSDANGADIDSGGGFPDPSLVTGNHNTFVAALPGAGVAIIVGRAGVDEQAILTNTIFADYAVALQNGPFTSTAQLDGVLWDNVTTPTLAISDGLSAIVTNALTGTAAFDDPGAADYHLSSNSLALENGVATTLTNDFDGDIRPYGLHADLGADEAPYLVDVRLDKTATPTLAVIGQIMTYTLAISNSGTTTAAGVTVTDTLPTSVTLWSPVTTSSGTLITHATQLTLTLASLAVGEVVTVTIPVVVTEAGVITNTARITVSNDYTASNNLAQVVVTAVSARCFTSLDGVTTYAYSADAQAVRDAIAAANPDDTVRIAGACAGAINEDGSNQVALINKPLTLAGGYTTTNWTLSSPVANPTTLDALAGGRVILSSQPLTVANLIIQNGLVNDENGGGINASALLRLVGSQIRNNSATSTGVNGQGGGVYVADAAYITGTTFLNNLADGDGGGALLGSTTTLTGTTFSGNRGHNGGGAFIWGATNLTGVTFLSNTATSSGGGISIIDPGVMTATTFLSNTAGSNGGGVYFFTAGSVAGTTFVGNVASAGGGAFFNDSARVTTTTFLANYAGNYGGGVYFTNSSAKQMSNSLLARNSASVQGAAIYVTGDAPLEILHSTISSPTVAGSEAIYIDTGTVSITNTIIASHTVGIAQAGGAVTENYNLFFGNGVNHTGVITSGGQSWSGDPHFVDPSSDDYRLTAGSAAANLGVDAGITSDFFGDPRPAGGGFDAGYAESDWRSDLQISKTVTPSLVQPGGAITYTLVVTNSGTANGYQVTLTDTLPTTLQNPTVSDPSSCAIAGQLVVCTGVTVTLTESWSLLITATAPVTAGVITNTVTVLAPDEANLSNNTAQVTVTVLNLPPVTQDDTATVWEDSVNNLIDVLSNDSDANNDSLTLTALTQPANGVAAISANQLAFTPTTAFNGVTVLTYTMRDTQAATATAVVTVTVLAVNDAPIAASDAYTTSEDTVLTIPASGVMGNDSDIDSALLTVTVASGPLHGLLALAEDGGFVYTPTLDYNGNDSFTYLLSDGALTSTATVSLTITPVDEPTATPTVTPTPTPTDLPTATATATATDLPTATSTATPTAEPTATPTDLPTPTGTATATDLPTSTPTDQPTATPTDLPTATATSTVTMTPTALPTATATDLPTATGTPTATATDLPTATATATPTNLPTATPTDLPTATGTATPTDLPTATATSTVEPTTTPTDLATATATKLPTATGTATPTDLPTATATNLPIATGTPTPTATNLPSVTMTATATDLPTATATKLPTVTGTATPTTEPTMTPTDLPTATATDLPTATGTLVPTATNPPSVTMTATATDLPTTTATMLPTATGTATPTDLPTNTVTPTTEPTMTPTDLPTVTGTPTPTATNPPSATMTATVTATNLPTATATATMTPTDLPTATATELPTVTGTPTPTATNPPSATMTATATDLPTATATKLPTTTATATPTALPTNTVTSTTEPTMTPTEPPTATATDLPTATTTNLPTVTPTMTPTDLPTNTATPTVLSTATATATTTATPTTLPTSTSTTTVTPTATDLPTVTPTDLPTATMTAPPTDLPTATATAMATPTDLPTATATLTPTTTATAIPTSTPTVVATVTPTATATLPPPTVTPTATMTATATQTPAGTPIVTMTPGMTATDPATPTVTATATDTPTVTPTATTSPPVIGDLVWHDRNGDGLHSMDEPPLAGITVTLYSTGTSGVTGISAITGTALMTTVTQLDGRYAFTTWLPGPYFIAFTSPPPYVPTLCNQGSDEAVDSDACRVDLAMVGQSASFTVTMGQTQADWDAGFTFPATIRGRAYVDRNRNNQLDTDEAPVSGLTIILQEGSKVEQSGRSFKKRSLVRIRLAADNRELARAVTAVDGSYTFANLTPGRYQLFIVVPTGFTAPLTILPLPWLNSGELLSEDAGLIALQPTNLTDTPEPGHRLYLPLVQRR